MTQLTASQHAPRIPRAPLTPHAIPAARLVVDTYIASKDWAQVESNCLKFASLKGWKDAEPATADGQPSKLGSFANELSVLAADSSYKLLEAKYQNNEHQSVLAQSDVYLKKYPQSKRRDDVLSLVGKSALALNNDLVARQYVSKIIDEAPHSKYFDSAVFLRAGLNERQFDYAGAKQDYQHYLALTNARPANRAMSEQDLQKKILLLTWVTGDHERLLEMAQDKKICTPKLSELCDQYLALSLFEMGKPTHRHWYIKSSAPNRAAWTLADLGSQDSLTVRERLNRMAVVAETWNEADALVRFSLVSRVTQLFRKNLEVIRTEVAKAVRVKANPKIIAYRLDHIKEFERYASRIIKIPVARIQVETLGQTANLYHDLAQEIVALPAPKGLQDEEQKVYQATMQKVAAPFQETALKLRVQAFEKASAAGVEAAVFSEVSSVVMQEEPELIKKLIGDRPLPASMSLSIKILDDFDFRLDGETSARRISKRDAQAREPSAEELADQAEAIKKNDLETVDHLKDAFLKAIQRKQWALVGYILQDSKQRSLVRAGMQDVMDAVALSSAGAQAEGLVFLDHARSAFKTSEERARVSWIVGRVYLSTLGRDALVRAFKGLDFDDVPGGFFNDDERAIVSAWTGEKL